MGFSLISVKCVPFGCIANVDQLFSHKLHMSHLFFLQQQWLHPDHHIKGFWSATKNPQFPPQNAQLFTPKISVIFVDFKMWCFPLSTGIT